MKQTFYIVITLLLTFLVPMFTSWLLDWEWISNEWPRKVLVILLMLVELLIGAWILIEIGKQIKKDQ